MLRRTSAAFAALLLVVACGSSQSESDSSSGGSSGSSGGTFKPTDKTDGGTGNPGDLDACATDKQQGKLAPLDLVLMQDTSGSMWGYTSGSTTKWSAIKSAMAAFMSDPSSAGIGIGLQTFPLFENGVPNSCTTNAECGAGGGACVYKGCSNSGALCESQAQCGGGAGQCTTASRCNGYQEVICLPGLTNCAAATGTGDNSCTAPIVRGRCQNISVSCAPAQYSGLAAPIAALPGAAAAVNAALDARVPAGQTPTGVALAGAIAAAKAQAGAHPEAVVAVVLSTDGIPFTNGKCDDDPANIAAIAQAAANPAPGAGPPIKTFVIGVLSPSDNTQDAKTTLDNIAAAGGTTAASIIGTSATTQADFIAALQAIRSASLPCEFALPVPANGTPDYGKVNVLFTDPATSGQSVIGYVDSASACDPSTGGWYYDADPAGATKPSKVILCPATCSKVQETAGGVIDVVQGCETRTSPK